jgi:ribonuclease BN (tRNA processing enzyme)
MGPDAPHRLAQEQLAWPNLDSIWISHFHLDHLGGLAPFLFGAKWAPQTQGREKPLRIFGPEGLQNLLVAIDKANRYRLLDQRFPVDLIELKGDAQFEFLPSVAAQVFSTLHTSESLAIRLTEKDGTSLVYTSDTGFSEALITFCRGADLLLLECSFHKKKPLETHLQLTDAMQIARECQPKRLVLTHLYPEWDGIDLANEAKSLWHGEILEARDGLILEV